MSRALAVADRGHVATLRGLAASIRTLSSVEDLQEVRARIEAVKGWAKVHSQVRELRLDLLTVEVEALVRIVQLGGADTLSTADRKAAEYLASMTDDERERLLRESGAATTASGMCRSIWQAEEIQERKSFDRARGRSFATTPDLTDVENASRLVDVAGAVKRVVEEYSVVGHPFEVADLAAEILDEAANGESWADDEAVVAGVREVVREAIRRQPVLTLNGLAIPRVLVARMADGRHVRIPTESATVAHLDSAIEIRREQIEADQAALRKLTEFKDRLGGATSTSRIGDIIRDSIHRAAS